MKFTLKDNQNLYNKYLKARSTFQEYEAALKEATDLNLPMLLDIDIKTDVYNLLNELKEARDKALQEYLQNYDLSNIK